MQGLVRGRKARAKGPCLIQQAPFIVAASEGPKGGPKGGPKAPKALEWRNPSGPTTLRNSNDVLYFGLSTIIVRRCVIHYHRRRVAGAAFGAFSRAAPSVPRPVKGGAGAARRRSKIDIYQFLKNIYMNEKQIYKYLPVLRKKKDTIYG